MEAKNRHKYQEILNATDYKLALSAMAKRIVEKSKNAPNEATIESYFDSELFSFFRENFGLYGFEYNPIKEKTVRRHTLKGRADTAIASLVIEFKQPSTFKNKRQQESAIKQICEYIESLGGKDENYQGFLTDGVKGCFIYYSNGKFFKDSLYYIDGSILDQLIRYIIQTELIALTSSNLVTKICNPPANDGIGFIIANTLLRIINKNIHPKTQMLYDEWRQLFNLAHDDISKQQAIIDRKKSLELLFNKDLQNNDEEYKALFCIQTAYAIIVKSLAFKVISQTKYKQDLMNFNNLIDCDSETLRSQLDYIENGAIFIQYGITNLLEGDFFSWYINPNQWNQELANNINQLYILLGRFNNSATINNVSKCQDFFKELYQSMVPAAVRHSLGEYYTKKWLSKEVIKEALPLLPIHWRALDPCCGSGTFITVLIEIVLAQSEGKTNKQKIENVLSRVKGIDLNPIAALTARVNYFINISHLIEDGEDIEIPIYLGDASYVPKRVMVDDVTCLQYIITTLQDPIRISVPVSMVKDSNRFSKMMTQIEAHIKAFDENAIYEEFISICDDEDKKDIVLDNLHSLASQLVELEKRQWNGVWARIITNFLSTANLGKFDLVVGNPPWVDWKSLPSGYREKIKSLCISRHLFSGDAHTGGINLNICALITNVAAQNWLSSNGIMALLMPEPLIFQQSYEGFRNLYIDEDERLYFNKFVNWNKAGHPFKPVTQKFLSFYISHNYIDYEEGVPTKYYVKKKGGDIDNADEINIESTFDIYNGLLGTCHSNKNNFTYASSADELNKYRLITGLSEYNGREGIEFYPQELLVFELSDMPSIKGCTALRNIQNDKSKYKVPQRNILLETSMLQPMIKGKDIIPFHAGISNYIVPFPYEKNNPQIPICYSELRKTAPRLAKYYQDNRKLIEAQTGYSDKIIGKTSAEYYALARVGAYSFAKHYVVLRDNTTWAAAVVTDIETEWGGNKRPVFQNHAISICEDSEGNFISLDEAYYICGILNAPIVEQYMMKSSDSRSFPIKPRIKIPKYNDSILLHRQIVKLSKDAHNKYKDVSTINSIRQKINSLYITLLSDAMPYEIKDLYHSVADCDVIE